MRRLIPAVLLLLALAVPPAHALDLKQGGTTVKVPFFLTLASDHVTPATGLSPTVTLSKNGGSFAAPAGTVAEVGNGWYVLIPASADTATVGDLIVHATASTADVTDRVATVVAYDPGNATSLGLANLTGGSGGGGSGGSTPTITVASGTIVGSTSPTSFAATLSSNASGSSAAYVGKTVIFQSGTANQQRGQIQSVTITGVLGAYTVNFVMNPAINPAIQATPAVGDTLVVF